MVPRKQRQDFQVTADKSSHLVDRREVAVGKRDRAAYALDGLVEKARHSAGRCGRDQIRHVSGVCGAVVAVGPPVGVRVQRVVHAKALHAGSSES